MSQQSITEGSAEKEQKLKRPIDMQIRVKYQYLEDQHSGKQLQTLVKFLTERTLHNKQTDRGKGEE